MKILNVIKEQNYFLFEILLILKFVAFLGPVLATGVLVQDKICLVTYHQSAEFCKNLQNPKDTAAEENVKHQILAESAKYNNYKTLVETLPLILWSLLLGPFLDTYPNSTFVIFFISILGDVLAALGNLANVYFYLSSPYLILLSSVSIWLTGGNMSFTTTAIMFITANSRESSRGIKFVLMEVIIVIGMAGATFISGQFLRTNAEGVQLRTYHYNYILTLSLDIIAIGLLFVLYMQKRGEKGAKMNATASTLSPTEGESEEEAQDKPPNGLKAFLNVDNVRQTLVAFFRPRPRHVRLQIFLLCYIQFSQMAITTGLGTLMMQFSEAVYAWDPRTYATYSAFQSAAGMLMLAAMSGVFITWLKLADSTLILIAQLSNFLADLIRGTFLSPVAFFISIPIGKYYILSKSLHPRLLIIFCFRLPKRLWHCLGQSKVLQDCSTRRCGQNFHPERPHRGFSSTGHFAHLLEYFRPQHPNLSRTHLSL